MDYINDLIKPDILSEISRDIGQVFFAGAVVEPIINRDASLIGFTIGLLLSMFCWFISVKITTK